MTDYNITTLPNGVRILSEPLAGFNSAALGIWVATGSRDESASENGAAHFIEHMLFKGTSTNSAEELAQRMDAIGGQVNAFTTKECTCFHARALKSHLPEALDILCSMFFDSRFDEEDVRTERGVILEEIGMYQDDPSDVVSERLSAAVYKGSSLARPILGKRSTLEKMTGEWLKAYKNTHYVPENIIVALAGSFDPSILEEIARRFSALEGVPAPRRRAAAYRPGFTLKKKTTEQNHLMLSFPALSSSDPRFCVMQVLTAIMGGGMSSRLFQEIREQRGLCYSIWAAGVTYMDTGYYCIYTALSRETELQALTAIRELVDRFAREGVTPEEVARVREMSKASILMSLESNTAHMNHLARHILNGTPLLTAEEIIARYDAVTVEDIRSLAQDIFQWEKLGFSAVGKIASEEEYRQALGL